MASSCSASIALDPLDVTVGELEADEMHLKEHLEANAEAFARAKELRARIKERKELVGDLMNEYNLDEYVAGDRVLTRTSAPKVLVTKKRVESHLGADAFEAYAAANVEIAEKLRVKKRKAPS